MNQIVLLACGLGIYGIILIYYILKVNKLEKKIKDFFVILGKRNNGRGLYK